MWNRQWEWKGCLPECRIQIVIENRFTVSNFILFPFFVHILKSMAILTTLTHYTTIYNFKSRKIVFFHSTNVCADVTPACNTMVLIWDQCNTTAAAYWMERGVVWVLYILLGVVSVGICLLSVGLIKHAIQGASLLTLAM